MAWILTICTQSWLLCGQYIEREYLNEESCYKALDELYRRSEPDSFKWVVCAPKNTNRPAP